MHWGEVQPVPPHILCLNGTSHIDGDLAGLRTLFTDAHIAARQLNIPLSDSAHSAR
jgi:hypothetical protein